MNTFLGMISDLEIPIILTILFVTKNERIKQQNSSELS